MAVANVRRRRDEYAEATRNAVLEAAADLFRDRGYLRTSLDEVAEQARVSKGAIYHHFANKGALFEALVVKLDTDLIAAVEAQVDGDLGAEDVLARILDAYLDASLDPTYARLVVQEGPIALGWAHWRKLSHARLVERFSALLEQSPARLPDDASAEMVMSALLGAMHEIALAVTESSDPDKAKAESGRLVRDLVASLPRGGVAPSAGQAS